MPASKLGAQALVEGHHPACYTLERRTVDLAEEFIINYRAAKLARVKEHFATVPGGAPSWLPAPPASHYEPEAVPPPYSASSITTDSPKGTIVRRASASHERKEARPYPHARTVDGAESVVGA